MALKEKDKKRRNPGEAAGGGSKIKALTELCRRKFTNCFLKPDWKDGDNQARGE